MSQNHNNDETNAVHYEDGIPILGPPPKNPDADQRIEREAQRSYEDRQISLQRRILLTQIGLVVFGLIGSGTSLWQASIGQYAADTTDRSVLLAQKTQRESRLAGEEQSRQSELALHATIDNFHQDQRAWVGVDSFALPECGPPTHKVFLSATCSGRLGVNVTNFGRTAAFDYLHVSKAFVKKTGNSFSIRKAVEKVDQPSKQVLFPGQRVTTYNSFDHLISTENLAGIADGTRTLYVVGIISYKDEFHNVRSTTYCLTLDRDMTGVASCAFGNQAN